MLPPKCPEGLVTVLDDGDVDHMLHRFEDLYFALVDLLTVKRRFIVRLPPRRPPDNIVSMRPYSPQSKGPDERGRP